MERAQEESARCQTLNAHFEWRLPHCIENDIVGRTAFCELLFRIINDVVGTQ
ncbi:hypothetical protein D3C72_2525760 [compost metagenome]